MTRKPRRTRTTSTAAASSRHLLPSESTESSTITLEHLSSQITSLRSDEISKQKEEIIERLLKENQDLRSVIKSLKDELSKKGDELYKVERDVIDLQQYVRRNNIELRGIPDVLGQKVIEIIGIKVVSNDIEACHRWKENKD